jgi:hypothetical protein
MQRPRLIRLGRREPQPSPPFARNASDAGPIFEAFASTHGDRRPPPSPDRRGIRMFLECNSLPLLHVGYRSTRWFRRAGSYRVLETMASVDRSNHGWSRWEPVSGETCSSGLARHPPKEPWPAHRTIFSYRRRGFDGGQRPILVRADRRILTRRPRAVASSRSRQRGKSLSGSFPFGRE